MFGFALIGQSGVNGADSFQIADIGYQLSPPETNFVDIGVPKNLGEGYRWNTRNIYYAYDATFIDYFGSNGMAAVDQAFAVYNSLSNVDSYSSDLSEWPQTSIRNNTTAAALGLLDLKSFTMQVIAEKLGLAQPQRWIYCLHDRFLPSGSVCPNYEYIVIQRNYDPDSQVYSAYVNGTLYGFAIEELCPLATNPRAPFVADALEYPADPAAYASAPTFAVADYLLDVGQFFTSLTRDDLGGLRYLYSTNRINIEAVDTNSLEFFTNTSNPQLLVTSNLQVFTQQALTNDEAALLALYPNLVITSVTNFFTNVVTTNIAATLVHNPASPAGTFNIVFVTSFTTNVEELFAYTFANVVTNHYYTNGFISTVTTNIIAPPNSPVGFTEANTNVTTIFAPLINGDFYIIPTNLCGPYQILSTQLVQVLTVTNVFGTNGATGANGITNGQSTIFDQVTYFTNYSLIAYAVQCDSSNAVELREGVEKMNFIRQDFDSLLSSIWTPITNFYQLTQVTNNMPFVQTYRRIVNAPDILINAQDLTSGPAAPPATSVLGRNNNYNSAQALPNLAGPGTLLPGTTITYNKVGPLYFLESPSFITDGDAILTSLWASFDGTTNTPVIYPDTVSLSNLVSEVFFQITTSTLPNASISTNNAGNPYNTQLQATGATPPYTWSLSTNSPALPPGLNLSTSGVISGVPTTTGIYDFTIQATDSGARISQRDFSIDVGP